MATLELKCFSCGEIHKLERVGFRQECDCGEDLHVCLNCKFYEPTSYNECKEPTAESVKEKDRSNLCEFFKACSAGADGKFSEKDDLLKAAEALFKK